MSPEKVVTIGNTIEHEITYPELAESIEVKYDEGSWNAGTTALQANQAVNVENLAFYLCQDLHTQVYDVVTNISVTFGVGIENDVTLDDTKSDFILLRDAKEKLFKLQVLNGEVYHNFSLVTEDCVLEPGDQLYTDGVTITIGKEDISVLAVKNRVTSKLAPLFARTIHSGKIIRITTVHRGLFTVRQKKKSAWRNRQVNPLNQQMV